MTRVIKSKMVCPATVEIKQDGNLVTIQSKKNKNQSFEYKMPEGLQVHLNDNHLSVISNGAKEFSDIALWGTTVRNIFNRVKGLDKPFEIKVDLVGVGYKAAIQGKTLVMDLGFSHKVNYELPECIECTIEKNTRLQLSSYDKERLGQIVGELTKIRPPEPYKGKGIIKEGTFIRRKEGKKKNA